MKKYKILFAVMTIALFSGGSALMYISIRNIFIINTVIKTQNIKNAIIVTIAGRPTSLEETIYFRVEGDNKPHRTHIVTLFSKNSIPKPMQLIHVRSDESGKLWIIDEYISETYAAWIWGIITASVTFVAAFFSLVGTIDLCKRF